MTAVLRVGGPLSIRCTVCQQPPGVMCMSADRHFYLRESHAERNAAAPPERVARAKDRVLVRHGGVERRAEVRDPSLDACRAVLIHWLDEPAAGSAALVLARDVLSPA